MFVKIALLTVGIFAGVFVYTWYRLAQSLHFHADKIDAALPASWQVKTEYVTTSDNLRIAYWYAPVSNAKAVVILIHGYHNPGGKGQMVKYAEFLHAAGYSTAMLDLRAFDQSEGQKVSLGVQEWQDVEAVFDHLRALPENDGKKIGLLGMSMGGSTALVMSGHTHKPDFVIASVPYADFDSLFRFQIQKAGFPTFLVPLMKLAARLELGPGYQRFTPSTLMNQITVPVLLFSAQRDEEVNRADARRLYELANQPKEYREFDSIHNIYKEKPEEFEKAVLEFLAKQSLFKKITH